MSRSSLNKPSHGRSQSSNILSSLYKMWNISLFQSKGSQNLEPPTISRSSIKVKGILLFSGLRLWHFVESFLSRILERPKKRRKQYNMNSYFTKHKPKLGSCWDDMEGHVASLHGWNEMLQFAGFSVKHPEIISFEMGISIRHWKMFGVILFKWVDML